MINFLASLTASQVGLLVLIVLWMLFLGIFFAKKKGDKASDKSAVYRKAVELETDEAFLYGIQTEVGNAFAYGTLLAEDPVSVDWLPNACLLAITVTERYTEHRRTVTRTEVDMNGQMQTHEEEEIYYTWDIIGSDEVHAEKIRFCNILFPFGTITLPAPILYDTQYEGFNYLRHHHYFLPTELEGSIFTELSGNGITYASRFFPEMHAKDAKEKALQEEANRVRNFWLLWGAIIAAVLVLVLWYWSFTV